MKRLKETVHIHKATLTSKVFVSVLRRSDTECYLCCIEIVSLVLFQPHFKTLSQLWNELHDETELLNIFINLALHLQPFLASQAEIFPEVQLDSLLGGSVVKTDGERQSESSGTAGAAFVFCAVQSFNMQLRYCVSGEQINPAEMESQEWLLPETTEGFSELPLQYNGVCGHTLVNTDGLLVPGNR